MVKEQEAAFESLLESFRPDVENIVGRIIEYNLCLHVRSKAPICEMTLSEIGNSYTESSPSRCGFSYDTYADSCEEDVYSFLMSFLRDYIKGCISRKMFTEYIEKEMGTYEDEDEFFDNLTEFAACLYGDCFCIDTSSLLDEELGKQKIKDVYSKYEFPIQKYEAEIQRHKDNVRTVRDALEKQAKAIIIPEIFRNKRFTRQNDDDKVLLRKLRNSYSRTNLALLFGTGRLTGSNSVSAEFESLYQEMLRKGITVEYPSSYQFLPELTNESVAKMIGKRLDEYGKTGKLL